jgi:hypothetical protein
MLSFFKQESTAQRSPDPMTMDWTVEQIFSELQSSGERIQQEQHLEQRNNSGHKFEEPFPTTSDYMDDLDDILNHHDDQWNDQYRPSPTAPTAASASTVTRTDDFWKNPPPTTNTSAPTPTRMDDFRPPDSAKSRHVSKSEEMDPTPSMLPYLPSPPPLQPPVPGKPTFINRTSVLFVIVKNFCFRFQKLFCSNFLRIEPMSV